MTVTSKLLPIHTYLCRQQERDLMQKARLLTDENSVSFQMFLILLSSITLCSESQIPVFKEGRSNTLKSIFVLFVCVGGGGACAEAKIWR